jgi:hypothetical protein
VLLEKHTTGAWFRLCSDILSKSAKHLLAELFATGPVLSEPQWIRILSGRI